MANSDPKIACFVAQEFGVRLLEGLAKSGPKDLLVVSYDDFYDGYYGYRSVLAYCKVHKIPCVDYTEEKDNVYDRIETFAPTHFICGYFARILPVRLLSLAPAGAFNAHPGDLPRYRGPFPTAWAILNGETSFVVTIHQMDSGIDTGDVVFRSEHPILPDETGFELYRRSMELAADLYLKNIELILAGRFAPAKQSGYGTYYGALPARAQVDWRSPCARIANEVRVHAPPYLPVQTFVKNKILLINKCHSVENDSYTACGPGRVLEVYSDGSFLASGVDGCLLVMDYEIVPKDKNRVSFAHVRPGVKLG